MGYKKLDMPKVEAAVKNLLEALGEDTTRPGLLETPRRVAKYWAEVLEGEDYNNEQIAEMFRKDFEVTFNSVVVKECKNIFSHCEHHLALIFNGTVYVAYMPALVDEQHPEKGYRVIGLSKIPRIVEMCSKRLQLQEKLCADIAECIELATGSNQVYVRSIMDHGCVSARGAHSSGVTDVTYITPALREDVEMRKEIESKVQELHLSSTRQKGPRHGYIHYGR